MFSPPFTTADHCLAALRENGFAVLDAAAVRALTGASADSLKTLAHAWDDLAPDEYLKDGGRYRRRRHASFIAQGGGLHDVPHRPHWQPLAYNALHGGMQRWFAPVDAATRARGDWRALLAWLAQVADALWGAQPWYGEAHAFRIDTEGGIGRPTPEGAHRDGVDLVAVFLVTRAGIKGGETRVFEIDGPRGQRFTLDEPWAVLLLDDHKLIHETTPVQPLAADAPGHRDTLVITLRAQGFLAPAT